LRVILLKIFKIFPAIYLADSGKFQIHMINSLLAYTGLKFAGLTIGSRKQRRVGTAAGVHQRGKLGMVPQKRPSGCVQESSARIFRYLTPKGINSQAQSLNKSKV
jgi:hypothetical protein